MKFNSIHQRNNFITFRVTVISLNIMYLISDVLKWDLYKNNVFEYLPIDFASQKFKTMAGIPI